CRCLLSLTGSCAKKSGPQKGTKSQNSFVFLCLFVAKKASVSGATSEPVFLVHSHSKHRGVPPTRSLPLCLSKNAFNHNAGILARCNLYLFHFVVAFISYLR